MLLSEVEPRELTTIIIPKVKAQWKELAFCMRYSIGEVDGFDKEGRNLTERCQKLFGNWLETNHDLKPKTYQTLLTYIKDVDELTAASQEIEKALIKGKDI